MIRVRKGIDLFRKEKQGDRFTPVVYAKVDKVIFFPNNKAILLRIKILKIKEKIRLIAVFICPTERQQSEFISIKLKDRPVFFCSEDLQVDYASKWRLMHTHLCKAASAIRQWPECEDSQ